jgi:hypothetical protein
MELVKPETRQGADDALLALVEMIHRFISKISEIKPQNKHFNVIVNAYAKACMPQQAEKVTAFMWALFDAGHTWAIPSYYQYTTVALAWRLSGHDDAPDRCELILKKIEALGQQFPSQFALTGPQFSIAVQCLAEYMPAGTYLGRKGTCICASNMSNLIGYTADVMERVQVLYQQAMYLTLQATHFHPTEALFSSAMKVFIVTVTFMAQQVP